MVKNILFVHYHPVIAFLFIIKIRESSQARSIEVSLDAKDFFEYFITQFFVLIRAESEYN